MVLRFQSPEVERPRKIERGRGLVFISFFLYHILVVKVQEIAGSGSYGENKTQNPKRTNKRNIRNNSLQLGSVPVPGPHMGAKLNQVCQEKPFLKTADSMKNKQNKPSFPETT